jgi:hypothetical protein
LKTNEGRLGLKMLVLRVIPGDHGVKANERYHRFESSGKENWAHICANFFRRKAPKAQRKP